jgi:hypothetical protein
MFKSLFCRPNRTHFILATLIGTSTLVLGEPALAATQGTLGATSTGSITISASVPNRARITGLTDVSFLAQDPNTTASSAQNVCLWSNTATKGYTITASGSGTASAFTLANGALTVPYSVQWSASSGQTNGVDGYYRVCGTCFDREPTDLLLRTHFVGQSDRRPQHDGLGRNAGSNHLYRYPDSGRDAAITSNHHSSLVGLPPPPPATIGGDRSKRQAAPFLARGINHISQYFQMWVRPFTEGPGLDRCSATYPVARPRRRRPTSTHH